MQSSTFTNTSLPSISDLFLMGDDNKTQEIVPECSERLLPRSSVLEISNLLSPSSSPNSSTIMMRNITPVALTNDHHLIKAKRKRASPNQLLVLNRIFSQTYFPSTEIRIQLGKQLGMSPRTVQIWFQNKRQSLRSRGRQSMSSHNSFYLPPISPPMSPLQRHSISSISTITESNYYSLPPLSQLTAPHTPSSSPSFPSLNSSI
ncbi:MAG: hypothetical protein EXX96DRAFT_569033 [Benjaminiella poitrasii]|nr:MAG: hypothetical protein EXX96DRAFT_569033 [Benjaminiella poitrasii]